MARKRKPGKKYPATNYNLKLHRKPGPKTVAARKRKPMSTKSPAPPRKPVAKQEADPKPHGKAHDDANHELESGNPAQQHEAGDLGQEHVAHEEKPQRLDFGQHPNPTDPDHPELGVTDDPSLPGYQKPD